MNELTAALKEELNVDTAFTLPIFGGIDIPESIAVSWGIMAFLVIVSILLTRNLKVNHISKRQAILETAVVTMDNFFKDLLGEAAAEAEHARRLRDANAETSALARDMCEKLLARNLTQQDDARLLDDLLQKAGDSNGK